KWPAPDLTVKGQSTWRRRLATVAAFSRTRTLNAAAYCVPVNSIPAGQRQNGQIADARDTVYGSDASCPVSAEGRSNQGTTVNPGRPGVPAHMQRPGAAESATIYQQKVCSRWRMSVREDCTH